MTFTFIPFFTDPTRIGQLYNRELIRMTEWQEDGKKHLQAKYKEIEKAAGETTKLITGLKK